MSSKTIQIDVASATVTYIGIASSGCGVADACWSIIRITTTGIDKAIENAIATDNSGGDLVWNDRATFSYS